jgi:hypothetical protein
LELPLISKDTPKTTTIVLKVSELLLNKGYTFLIDNYYNSPALVKFWKLLYTDSKQEGYAEESTRKQAREG